MLWFTLSLGNCCRIVIYEKFQNLVKHLWSKPAKFNQHEGFLILMLQVTVTTIISTFVLTQVLCHTRNLSKRIYILNFIYGQSYIFLTKPLGTNLRICGFTDIPVRSASLSKSIRCASQAELPLLFEYCISFNNDKINILSVQF